MEVDIICSLIDGAAVIIAALIPAAAVYFASKEYLATKQARGTALTALLEVRFLRELEKEACEKLSELQDKTPNAARLGLRTSLKTKGFTTENKLPPSELERRIKTYEKAVGLSDKL